jgi:hypothetical protein
MATLNGNSTDAEVWAAYDDNASYEEHGSRTKALALVTACRVLWRRLPHEPRPVGGGAPSASKNEGQRD